MDQDANSEPPQGTGGSESVPRSGSPADPHADPIADAILEYLALLEAGDEPDLEAFCAQHPVAEPTELLERCRDVLHVKRCMPEIEHALGESGLLHEQLGDFRLLREIGRGGMGVVYLARQLSLHRRVAVKVLPPHFTRTQRQIDRFRREARALGRIKHPHIVPIHTVGEEGETLFFAMDYVRGSTLHRELELYRHRDAWKEGTRPLISDPEGRSFFQDVAAFFSKVAEALACAHRAGIVHRDVKPQNILIDEGGEPYLVDFGLAKDETQGSISRSGDIAGTPYYMSPEQALAKRVRVDHRTDVFSMGIVLYELLTLRRPFEGRTSQEILYQITFREAPRLRHVNPKIPRDLEAICECAMAKSPGDRYASAEELAADLRRFAAGIPILAPTASNWQRGRRWLRRHRTPLLGLGAAISLLLLGGLLFNSTVGARDREGFTLDLAGTSRFDPVSFSVLRMDPETDDVVERIREGSFRSTLELDLGWYRIVALDGAGQRSTRHALAWKDGQRIELGFDLRGEGFTDAGMVRVAGDPSYGYGDLWVDEAEVSNAEYREFFLDVDRRAHRPAIWGETYRAEWDDYPVAGLPLESMERYANWAGKRLPTSHEWGWVTRRGDSDPFPWGESPEQAPPCASWNEQELEAGMTALEDYREYARPVKSCPEGRTKTGLYHAIGNVPERTLSPRYEAQGAELHADEGWLHGGHWHSGPRDHHAFPRIDLGVRWFLKRESTGLHIGFRCVRSIAPETPRPR